MMSIQILDVYSDNAFDAAKEKAAGTNGVIFKGGQGMLTDVPRVHPEWIKACKDNGLAYGFYWVVDPRISVGNHVRAIQSAFPPKDFGTLGFWLDCEKPFEPLPYSIYWLYKNSGWNTIYAIMVGLQSWCGNLPGIYTNPDFWWNITRKIAPASAQWFAQAPLWIAQYGVVKPSQIGAWISWDLWQYHPEPDYSFVNDAVADKYFSTGSAVTPPAPIPSPAPQKTMTEIDVIVTDGSLTSNIIKYDDGSSDDKTSITKLTVATTPTPSPVVVGDALNLWTARKWGDPVLTAYDYFDTLKLGTSNFQIIPVFVEEAQTGKIYHSSSVSGFLKIPQADVNKLIAMLPPDSDGVPIRKKINWLRGPGRPMWIDQNDPTSWDWGHGLMGGGAFSVDQETDMDVMMLNAAQKTREHMLRIVCFTPSDWGKTNATHPWLVQRCTAASYVPDTPSRCNIFTDTPTGGKPLPWPLFSPKFWAHSGGALGQVKALWISSKWAVKA